MRKLIINESEKNRILGLYNLKEENVQNVQACPVVSQNSTNIKDLQEIIANITQKFPKDEPYSKLNSIINTEKNNFTSQGIPQRIACEISLQSQRTSFAGKNIIIIDTNKNQQLMYIFDSNKRFVAKDYVISGMDSQSTNQEIIGKALSGLASTLSNIGWRTDEKTGSLINTKNPKLSWNPNYLYQYLGNEKMRFLPSGIYVSAGLGADPSDAGYKQDAANQFFLTPNGQNVDLAQAIHGFMLSDENRKKSMDLATKSLGSPNDPSVSKQYYELFKNAGFKSKLSNGCINVPERMIDYLRQYGVNSVILNLSEDEGNYLVSNGKNFLQKSGQESCPSPQSLGAEEFNVA